MRDYNTDEGIDWHDYVEAVLVKDEVPPGNPRSW